MLKALVKNQLLALASFFLYDRKTGKQRKAGGIIGFVVLYLFVFLSVGMAMMGVAAGLGSIILEPSMSREWLYFAMMGVLAIVFGSLGSAFSTYTSLYLGKDNELLLSLPIPSHIVMLSRMISVYLVSLLYSALVWIPALIFRWTFGSVSALSVVYCLLYLLINALLVTVISCVLGWAVAAVSLKLKGKSILSLLLFAVFFFFYYYFVLRINNVLSSLAMNLDRIDHVISGWLFPFYHLGLGASGKTGSFLLYTLIVLILFGLCLYVMSRSFNRIVTKKPSEKKAVYHEALEKQNSVGKALLLRELKHFLHSTPYLMNAGFGLILMPALGVFAIVRSNALLTGLEPMKASLPVLSELLPIVVFAVLFMTISMNAITAPSISLEGSSFWIVRTMPIDSWEILKAKEGLHVLLNGSIGCLTAVLLGIALKLPLSEILLLTASTILTAYLTADVGLRLGLKYAYFDWTNEAFPLKNSPAVMFLLFGSWLLAIVFIGLAFLLCQFVSSWIVLILIDLLLLTATLLLRNWLRKRGGAVLESL